MTYLEGAGILERRRKNRRSAGRKNTRIDPASGPKLYAQNEVEWDVVNADGEKGEGGQGVGEGVGEERRRELGREEEGVMPIRLKDASGHERLDIRGTSHG